MTSVRRSSHLQQLLEDHLQGDRGANKNAHRNAYRRNAHSLENSGRRGQQPDVMDLTLFCATSPVATPTPYGRSASAMALRSPRRSAMARVSARHESAGGDRGRCRLL